MHLYSTNQQSSRVPFREAVLKGLSDDGGLFMPVNLPVISIEPLRRLSFPEVAFEIARVMLAEDLPEFALQEIIFSALNFDVPLVRLSSRIQVLELFHGPTLSFKDFGARFMARLLSYFVRDLNRPLTILVATSGDTGSAVAHGFLNVDGTQVVLLYPSGMVSEIQEKQLTTTGGNVVALEVEGTFDDCQRLVKQAFADEELKRRLNLTSANSINIARLIPQSFYYWYTSSKLDGINSKIVVSVPSGNYGNLTAGLMAKKMGLPVARFIAAANRNDVVPAYLRTGNFEPRPSVKTLSNAMDVGNPSNFARILALYNQNIRKIRADVQGSSFSDQQTVVAIREIFQQYQYVAEPHGAVGYLGLKEYLESNSDCIGIFLETAHPAKFADTVSEVLGRVVQVPERLKRCLQQLKKSILLPNDFEAFKSLLLS